MVNSEESLIVLFSKVVYLNVLTIIIFFVSHARIGTSKNSDLYLPYLGSFICLFISYVTLKIYILILCSIHLQNVFPVSRKSSAPRMYFVQCITSQ